MRNTILIVALFFYCQNYSQNKLGVITKNDRDTITIYDGSNNDNKKRITGMATGLFGQMGFNEKTFYYFDVEGNIKELKHTEYTEIIVADKHLFMTLPHGKRGDGLRFHRIIAQNDKYILGDYLGQGFYFYYVFDKEKNLVDRRIQHFGGKPLAEKAIKKVKKYFGDCPELINGMETNLSKPGKSGMIKTYEVGYYWENGEAQNFLSNIQCN